MIVRSFGSNGQFQMVDWTEELLQVPNTANILDASGLFDEEGVTQHTITFEEIKEGSNLIVDRVRGERNTVNSGSQRRVRALSIPHFPLDDAILPQDIQGFRAYGSPSEVETEAAVMQRKLKSINKAHAETLEVARWRLLRTGEVYAPSGTVAMNMYTEFGVTRQIVDMDLTNGGTNVINKQEEVLSKIRAAASGENITQVVGYASTSYFNAYVANAGVQAAYANYQSQQEPLRNRVGALGALAWGTRRSFIHGNVLLVEVYESLGGEQLVQDGTCIYVPYGTSIFKTFFSPANKRSLVNTIGEKAYLFEFEGTRDDKVEVESESNFANICRRPLMVVIGKVNSAVTVA